MAKYYAVKEGRVPGIYMSWGEAEPQVKGYSGASYKSFKTKKEAEEFINASTSSVTTKNEAPTVTKPLATIESETSETNKEISTLNSIEIYVDGSYSPNPPLYSSGWVAVKNNEIIKKNSFCDNDERYIESHQVPGEVFACIDAINWAKAENYDNVTISYDYQGIEKWATREWKANKSISKDYVTLFDNASEGISVSFNKVKAHSGINFNEIADKLAKGALLKRGVRSNSDGGVTIFGVDKEELELIFDLISSENPNFKLYPNTEREKDGYINYTLKSDDSRVIINCYDTGKTTVQGKDSPFMQYTLTLLLQLCENEEDVVETLNVYNNISIDTSLVEEKFNEVLPNYKHKSNKLEMSLKQAAYNLTVSGVRYEYTDLPMPILRVIDHYLHKILQSVGLNTVSPSGTNNFGYFAPDDNDSYYLQTKHVPKFDKAEKVDFLNKLYNFYKKNRHTLFHWDEEPEDTRVLSTLKEAHDILIEGFALINDYYIIFD